MMTGPYLSSSDTTASEFDPELDEPTAPSIAADAPLATDALAGEAKVELALIIELVLEEEVEFVSGGAPRPSEAVMLLSAPGIRARMLGSMMKGDTAIAVDRDS